MRLDLTKRGDYAVRAMLALTREAGHGLLSARRIADAMAIPVRFLAQVLADLQRAGLIAATPGRAGGYRLARGADEISLLDVIEAVEGDSRHHTCVLRGDPCGVNGTCDVHDVFARAQDALLATLAGQSLAGLVRSGAITLRASASGPGTGVMAGAAAAAAPARGGVAASDDAFRA